MNDIAPSVSADPKISRLLKNRSRDHNLLRLAKNLLIRGMPPGKVSLLLRLDYQKVLDLYENSYNPRCRRLARPNQFQQQRSAARLFEDGSSLIEICTILDLPLFSVVSYLQKSEIPQAEILARMPNDGHPLMADFKKTAKRHAQRKQKSPQLH
ncbi:hypothetical protein [Dryocola clanedunensis]|uniref:hypothetical protein n=1 Tax=Cedecea sulfonylureivorans TaxID=3051154 RepID=UPI001928E9E2|nr:hypothetical protein [Cedecea sulfonylureivorans]